MESEQRALGARLALTIAAAVASITVTAQAQTAPAFAIGENSFVRGLFIDGDTLAIGGSQSRVVRRSGQVFSLSSGGGTLALCGRRVGDRLVIVHAGYSAVLRSDGVHSASGSAPLIEREQLRGCAVDSTGAVYFAGEHHAVYRWSGDDWSVLRFGESLTVTGLALASDDTLYVLTATGLVRRSGAGFERVSLGNSQPSSGEPGALWISDRTHRAYIAWGSSVVVLDLRSGASRAHAHGMFGSASAITGVAAPSGDLVAVAAQSRMALFDGQSLTALAGEFVFPRALAFDPAGRALYVGAQSASGAIAVDHPWLGAYAATLPTATELPVVAQSAPVDAHAAPRDERVAAQQSAPIDRTATARSDPYTFIPAVRFGFGAAMGTGATRNLETGFSFDATAGVFGYRERSSVQFFPELGVAYQGGPTPGGTYFRGGGSVLYGSLVVSGGLSAHALIGGSSAGFAAGMRAGVIVQTLLTGITLDLGYQFLPTAIDNRHAFVGTIAINPIPLILGIWFASGFFRFLR